jgi:hypothetical protein
MMILTHHIGRIKNHLTRHLTIATTTTTNFNGRVTTLDDGSESTKGAHGHYYGEWDVNNERPHGKGSMNWDNGVSYDGTWLNGMYHGRGSKMYSRGGGYVGAWECGVRKGLGEHHFAGKFGYEKWKGTFKHDKPSGVGMMTLMDGKEVDFTYDDGTAVTKLEQEDEFFDGTLSHLDDGSESTIGISGVYVGAWDTVKMLPHNGYGVMRWDNGIEYKGMWHNGKYHGHGRKLYSRGGGYEGLWVDGKRVGTPGITFYSEGVNLGRHGILRWEGNFVNNLAHGIGQAYVAAGDDERMKDDDRWVGDTAVKGPKLEFQNGRVINFPTISK